MIEQGAPQMRTSRGQRRKSNRHATTRRDVAVGVGLGLAALAIAAAVQSGAYSHSGNIDAVGAGPVGVDCCGARSIAHVSSTARITVRVRISGGLERLLGSPELQVMMPAGGDVASLGERLSAEYPSLGPIPMLIVAGSNPLLPEMLSPAHALSDGDLVELIPPMSGG